jgi:hypothetical protein
LEEAQIEHRQRTRSDWVVMAATALLFFWLFPYFESMEMWRITNQSGVKFFSSKAFVRDYHKPKRGLSIDQPSTAMTQLDTLHVDGRSYSTLEIIEFSLGACYLMLILFPLVQLFRTYLRVPWAGWTVQKMFFVLIMISATGKCNSNVRTRVCCRRCRRHVSSRCCCCVIFSMIEWKSPLNKHIYCSVSYMIITLVSNSTDRFFRPRFTTQTQTSLQRFAHLSNYSLNTT